MSTPEKNTESRRHRRWAVDAGVMQVSWLDLSGKMRITRTRALNISEDGMALSLPEAVMPLMIRFQIEKFKVNGVGVVKHCRRAGGQYVVGLEFTEGLHWRAPQHQLQEPIPVCDPEAVY